MIDRSAPLVDLIAGQPVIPVVIIADLDRAVPLARALVAGGLPAIEVTLRTPVALDAIRRIAREVPEANVGAGTILSPRDYENAAEAGARFIVSPGASPALLDAAAAADVPFLPGANTPSEIIALAAAGYTVAKFFPAEQAGGAAYLKSLGSPFAAMRFCPTGGISTRNARDYLSLPNVICIGGSWVAPEDAMAQGRWDDISRLAAEAVRLRA